MSEVINEGIDLLASVEEGSNQPAEEIVKDLRKKSRRKYLQTREDSKLKELELLIKDEESLFGGEKLKEEETKQIALQKKILDMAKETLHSRQEIPYEMPDVYSPERILWGDCIGYSTVIL
jgi:hypothetical protein